MKTLRYFPVVLFLTTCLILSLNTQAQNIAITDDDSYVADSSAMLDVKSLTKGMLVPRLTTTQRNAISNPATGLLVFDNDELSFFFYNGTEWINLSSGGPVWEQTGSSVHLADSANNVGVGTSAPQNKLVVKGDASSGIDEAIFAVVSPAGDTIFAVYPEGTRVYVKDDPAKASGNRAGFAVGGFSLSKGLTNEYLRVTPDSVRVYIKDTTGTKASGNRGGFAVGGFSLSKGINDSLYLFSDRTGFNVTYLTQAERDAITNPRLSSIIFNTTDSCLQIFLGYWESIWCTPMGCVYPAISEQPANDTAIGVPATFTVTASGSKIYYKWQESADGGSTWQMLTDGGTNPEYSGAYTDSLIISNIPEYYNDYQYRCYVSNACGNEISFPVVLTNCEWPSIQAQPVNDTTVSGPSVFYVSASGVPLYYSWQESSDSGSTWNPVSDGGTDPSYSGANNDTLVVNNFSEDYYGYRYRCYVSNACSNEMSSPASIVRAAQVGDTLNGGIVFYNDGNWIYISATVDQSTSAEYGCNVFDIPGAEGIAIGTGEQNTIDIEAGCATAGIGADICANLVYNGYDDWFLPSKDELNQMYINKNIIGGFSSGNYWSSSEQASNLAWFQSFSSGSQFENYKDFHYYIRCIRRKY
ncbi:MAG: DUF1566 domain-containing protein [Bacteroidetes bacterium]|nr:DUF1566 domain-containing protein [Bacteroidota bacterium]